ncbi:MAG: TonB-dependent receptor [Xanthomonadaceae bacterium]|jgi:iron complex outermembrane receptor protein|nr:TonB-dependent receptor [Xanthomonadaceae bacterium]
MLSSNTRFRHFIEVKSISYAIGLAIFPTLAALAHEPTELPTVSVTATPQQSDAESSARPVEVLYGEQLDAVKAATLGDTVSKLPGVQTSYFGPGVGRPIIRGQEGPRVQVLVNGMDTQDVSTVSADHATAVEPFLTDQIEVLKGPATLLFGNGAIGGAVNVVDGRIARDLPDRPLSGRAEIRGNTVNDERSGMFRLDGVNGNWVIHVDGLVRNTDDYDIPGYALTRELREEEGGDSKKGRLENSSIKTRAGAVGATWLGEPGYFGFAASTYRSNYGIPNGAHVHVEGDDHDHGHDHDSPLPHDDEGSVRIDLTQNRFDLKTGLYDPASFLKNLNLRAAYTDYEHTELENGQAATRFTHKGLEGRLEAVQAPWAGWNGAFGLQFGHADFTARGEEAFVPATETRNWGVFVVQDRPFGPLKLELGGRYDRISLKPADGFRNRDFNALNFSAAGLWSVSEHVELRAGLDRSERAPTNEELYSAGAHVATRSLETGDQRLDSERGLRAELGMHVHHGWGDLKLSLYQTRFKNFIYLADTGITEDALPVRLWTQQDAVFKGIEAEAVFHLADSSAFGQWDLRLFGDYIRAQLDGSGSRSVDFSVPHDGHRHDYRTNLSNSGYLPRIAPARFGMELNWAHGGLRASIGAVRYQKQDDVAANEAPSSGYTLVDAHLAYRWDRNDSNSWELFLDGTHLTDREVQPHTSLLRDYAPLPGRGVAFGIRAYF